LIAKGSAKKRQKQNIRQRLRNRMVKSKVKTSIKKYLDAIEAKNKEKAEASFKEFTSIMDNSVNKGIYHKNTVARKKSRMHHLLHKMSV